MDFENVDTWERHLMIVLMLNVLVFITVLQTLGREYWRTAEGNLSWDQVLRLWSWMTI